MNIYPLKVMRLHNKVYYACQDTWLPIIEKILQSLVCEECFVYILENCLDQDGQITTTKRILQFMKVYVMPSSISGPFNVNH